MPISRNRGKKQPKKVGASHADRARISNAFQTKLVKFGEMSLEELKAIDQSQKDGNQKKYGGAYQKAFEFALLVKENEAKQPKELGESTPIELDGLSATITPVEDVQPEEEYEPDHFRAD